MIFKNVLLTFVTVVVTLSCSMTVPVYSDQFESFDPSSYGSFKFIKPEPFSDTSDISEKPIILTRISRSILGSLEDLSLDEDQAILILKSLSPMVQRMITDIDLHLLVFSTEGILFTVILSIMLFQLKNLGLPFM